MVIAKSKDIEQVANMFGEAQREDNLAEYRKQIQNGMYSRTDPRSIQKQHGQTADLDIYKRVSKTMDRGSGKWDGNIRGTTTTEW